MPIMNNDNLHRRLYKLKNKKLSMTHLPLFNLSQEGQQQWKRAAPYLDHFSK
jgi:hypothetical protein